MMRLVIDSRLSEIRRASGLVDEFKARHGLGDEDSNAIHVVLDEVLNNSIRHGLARAASHAITVTLHMADGEIVMGIEDDGIPFDPTHAARASLNGTLDERTEGGMGLEFVRGLTDSIQYERVAERNRLVLRRRVREARAKQ